MTLDNILEEIKKADKIAILTHENPDGDALSLLTIHLNELKILYLCDLIHQK